MRGDFDGDGKFDAAVFRASDQIWYIKQSSNNQPRYGSWGSASDKRVSGDFDGDGKTGIAVFRDGIWYMLRSQQGFGAVQFGATNDRPIPAAFVP